MSGRGHGRGSINMTQAELTNLINTRVAEALAAYQADLQRDGRGCGTVEVVRES
ncbi:hypothetical protein HanPSC8_Chr05g0212761 [Helianthus annuus]|nr:hypothetical protein HanPSC8_Chr05g0212761 [Helianthus annuus]